MKRGNIVNRDRGTGADRRRHIYGVHAVGEWIRAQPRQLDVIHYNPQAAHRLAPLLTAATAAGLTAQATPERTLTMLAGTTRHQDVVATARAFSYATLEAVLAQPPDMLVVADQLQDPHNLGALLRTAEAVGAGALILPKDAAAAVTASVEAAAAGAAALLPVCRVTNLARTLRALQQQGYWIAGLAPRQGTDLFRYEPSKPLAIVIGGEQGLRSLVAQQCDVLVTIPMFGRIESLNASVAMAVALYQIRRHWETAGRETQGRG